MNTSREEILQAIRCATTETFEKPDLTALEEQAIVYPDVVEQFCHTMSRVGGKAVIVKEGEDVNEIIRTLYPEVKRIASNIERITCATFNPDEVEAPADLNGTDLAVIDGKVGVAENGAVWIEQDVKQRALYFISERLVILLRRQDIVNNMHEAYRLIDTGEIGFGAFISGPSKTADIEQALVMGAHGAREVVVLIEN